MDNLQGYTDKAVELAMLYAPKLLLAIITLIVGIWIINMVTRFFNRAMEKGKVDESLRKFLASMAGGILKVLLLISVASMVGIETTSFIAIIGAAGLAVGLALQGSLANFAGGVLILLFKPYKVGDVIEAQGYTGKVNAIQVFNTVLKTPDNKTIIIPNGAISGGSITNYSTEPTRRVDMVFGIGYDDDIQKAKNVLQRILDSDNRVLKDPAPMIALSELADSSVNFTVRVWCNAADYWGIYFDMQERVKLEFDKEGISIPYPQRDVHLYKANGFSSGN
ncbi:MAG: mechanosensitive ion channel family protein [Methanobacteriota archaeon]|nr:MAG: mechanosensitive ion channel family protein [Euryarchaeota archaeon]